MAAPYTAVNRRGLVFSSNLNTITHMRCFRRGITSSNKIQKQLTDICVASFSCFCVCVVYTYDFKNWFYERSKNATLIRFVSGKQWKQNKNNVSMARRFDRGSVEERNLKKRKNRRCTINIVAALLYKLLWDITERYLDSGTFCIIILYLLYSSSRYIFVFFIFSCIICPPICRFLLFLLLFIIIFIY